MRLEKTDYGSVRWFIEGEHSASFVHVNRNKQTHIEVDKDIDTSIYLEKGTCKVVIGNNTLIIQEGSSLQVPLDKLVSIFANFGDVDLIFVRSFRRFYETSNRPTDGPKG